MRTKNSIKNIISSFVNTFILNILRFISRMIFIKQIGELYLGVNGLLSNVLGLLSLAELGIGSAIAFSLYKPLADDDYDKINSIMFFYKKAYRTIGLIIFFIGLVMLPLIPHLINDTTGIENLSLIYFIFLINMVVSYFFSYKRTLVDANQKNYTIVPITVFFSFLTTVLQIIVMLVFKNFIIYLLIQTLTVILENIFVNIYINKQYPYLKENNVKPLDDKELKGIKKQIKALFFHKIGSYAVNSTDNLIISKMIGIITVGLYSNYLLILNTINSFISTIVNNVLASFGNLIVKESSKKSENVFKELRLFSYFMYAISTICFINIFNPFITIWLGKDFLLPMFVVYIISINNYFFGINYAVILTKTAGGLFDEDKYFPILEAVINLVASIILAKYLGLAGVFLGTFIGKIPTLINKPMIVYNKIFKKSSKEYFLNAFKQVLLLIIMLILTKGLLYIIPNISPLIDLIINILISGLLPLIIIILVYKNTYEFKNLINRFKKLVLRRG